MAKLLFTGAFALLGLIGAAARAGEKDVAPSRMYHIDVKIVEYDAEGKKLSENRPAATTMENRQAGFFAGQEVANSAAGGGVEFLQMGTSVKVVVGPLSGGKVRVDASMESSWQEPAPKSKFRIRSNSVHTMETVRLGETIREELDRNPDEGGSRVVEITVQEADQDAH
jgi:hypothetical protein